MNNLNPYLSDLGIVNVLGEGKKNIWDRLIRTPPSYPELSSSTWGDPPYFGLEKDYEKIDEKVFKNRLNRMLGSAVDQISPAIDKALRKWGPGRIGVVVGSTDNGSEMALISVKSLREKGKFPDGYTLESQSAHSPAAFLKSKLGTRGPDMAVSTACSSSSVALICARELIRGGICDAVVAGGADIVSQAVYMGFNALEAVSPTLCNPFSRNRDGITLGDGAAVFLVSRDDLGDEGIRLLGAGESADAYHMTAPDPEGLGAESAMRKALSDSKLAPGDIDYLNLHGTGTELNDSMESRAVSRVFGNTVLCSSTKPLTGHTLGAAGSTEAGICWLALSSRNPENKLPVHRWDSEIDSGFPNLNLIQSGLSAGTIRTAMSNSFAFGGNDTSIILGRQG